MKINLMLIIVAAVFITSCSSRKRVASQKSVKKTEKHEKVKKSEGKVVETKTTSKRKVAPPKKKIVYKDIKMAYIARYASVAMDEMRKYKIPASITLAQGILESRSGQSGLTKKSNNHFGIKCHKGWTGGKTYHDDDEKDECFRVYKHPEKSFKDHSLFLAERKRYADLFRLKITDYKGWAKGLKKAGYATDPAYPNKLIGIIESYELYDYDDMVLGKNKRKRRKEIIAESKKSKKSNGTIIVVKGDALYSISKRYGMSIDELKELNGLKDNSIAVGQELIVVKSDKKKEVVKSVPKKKEIVITKKKSNSSSQERHNSIVSVKGGDTLYSISKGSGLTVDELKELNGLTSNSLAIGQELIVKKYNQQEENTSIASKKEESIIVVKGDTMYSIAKRYGLTVVQLKDLNNLIGNNLSIGQELKILK